MLKLPLALFFLHALPICAHPAEQHRHFQHLGRLQQPLVIPNLDHLKAIDTFSVGSTTCTPSLIPDVFGKDLEQFAFATAFCSSFLATTTTQTQTATVTPFLASPVTASATAKMAPLAIPTHVVYVPSSSLSSACSCLITDVPTRTATRTTLAYAMPTGADLHNALRRGNEMRHEKRIELNDVHAGLEARFVRS